MIYVRGHPIRIFTMDEDDITLYIAGGESAPCFRLEIEKAGTHAVLGEVIRRNKCFADNSTESRNLVRAAYQVARDRGIRTLEITDNSVIYCPDRVILSDLSFLTTGKTWYESIISLTCMDFPQLEQFRRKVLTNTWRTVGGEFRDIRITGIDIDAPGSALQVLAAMKREGSYCRFFSDNIEALIYRSGIKTLHGKQWISYIANSTRARSTARRTSSGRRRTRRVTGV